MLIHRQSSHRHAGPDMLVEDHNKLLDAGVERHNGLDGHGPLEVEVVVVLKYYIKQLSPQQWRNLFGCLLVVSSPLGTS